MIPSEADRIASATGMRVKNVVVTPALKLWHTLRSLELVYSDAFHNQLNDRYAGKRDAFRERVKGAYERLIQAGLGMASNPVPRAASPTLASAPGSLPDGNYYATMGWVSQGGEEGASATSVSISLMGSAVMVVPATAPPTAVGWNVYVGAAPEAMVRQNGAPNAPGQAWIQLGGLLTEGASPSNGQPPSYTQPIPRMIQRG